ncbi:hypothetical protein GTQ99_11270 [Kineococcus sp. T13]|uniref:hypothetical protein n=1 Tax=Kineococcus vitellinus TaxID=2696565 RepID=UPI001412CAE5|nr:hypothetical protein [Kineococcus vitellinus]NAZ75988.1 hypothetical protein [Kineococcus vitellinus]
MSGGQLRGDGQRPLHEVLRRQRAAEVAERPAGRHCWVRPPEGEPGPWPGVVVAWARGREGWRGRVVYVVPPEPGEDAVVVEAWVDARHLTPVLR